MRPAWSTKQTLGRGRGSVGEGKYGGGRYIYFVSYSGQEHPAEKVAFLIAEFSTWEETRDMHCVSWFLPLVLRSHQYSNISLDPSQRSHRHCSVFSTSQWARNSTMGLEGISPGPPHYSLPKILHRVRVWGSWSVSAQLPCSGSVMPTFQRKSKDAQKHNIHFFCPWYRI